MWSQTGWGASIKTNSEMNKMMELVDKDFKNVTVNISNYLKENMDIMKKEMET